MRLFLQSEAQLWRQFSYGIGPLFRGKRLFHLEAEGIGIDLIELGSGGKCLTAFDIRKDWACWLVSGILVSGGSAFWNHLLDIVKAAKVQKEAAATSGATPITP